MGERENILRLLFNMSWRMKMSSLTSSQRLIQNINVGFWDGEGAAERRRKARRTMQISPDSRMALIKRLTQQENKHFDLEGIKD